MDAAVGCPYEEATALLIDVEKLDTYILNLKPDEELFVLCTMGDKSLKTAPGKIPSSGIDDPISFDSLLQFPFSSDKDPRVIFSLRERVSLKELGRYTFDMSLFKGQKPTRSVRIKLKNGEEKGIGFLELKMKLGHIEGLEKPVSLKYVKTPRAVKSWMVANEINDEYNKSATKQIACCIYKVQDIRHKRQKVTLTINLGAETAHMHKLDSFTQNAPRVEILPVDLSVAFDYKGNRFLKFALSELGVDDPWAEGEVDLLHFVTNRANVYVGSVALEAVRNASGASMPQGILYFRLEKSHRPVVSGSKHLNPIPLQTLEAAA